MEKLIDCQICFGHYHVSREHCPYCGAKMFIVDTGGKDGPWKLKIMYRDVARPQCELVRAYRSDLAFKFIVQ